MSLRLLTSASLPPVEHSRPLNRCRPGRLQRRVNLGGKD